MANIAEPYSLAKHDSESLLQNLRLSQTIQSLYSRSCFIHTIFNLELNLDGHHLWENPFEAFFSRYATLCSLAANTNRAIVTITHWQFAIVIKLVRDPGQASRNRSQLIDQVLNSPIFTWDDSMIGEHLAPILIDLAVDVGSMLSVAKFPGDISYDEPIHWEDNTTLADLVYQCFPSVPESEDIVKLPQTFTAAHLEKIGGIQVIWTSNLADHLLLKEDDTKLMLFHQVSILKLHHISPNNLFPKGLVDETIRTISLLVPPALGEPTPWFRQQQQMYKLDAEAGNCNRLNSSQRQIKNFVFWRDRLVLLKRTFDDAEPRNLSQLWWDDRRKTQWFTFWVAVMVFVLTLFFGIVQSVAGIVQAWASVQGLRAQHAHTRGSS